MVTRSVSACGPPGSCDTLEQGRLALAEGKSTLSPTDPVPRSQEEEEEEEEEEGLFKADAVNEELS
jgi:hypothetical protein